MSVSTSPAKIQIFNSLGGLKAPFVPLDSSPTPKVKMYVCGLTPQDHSHLGHGTFAVRFDMVRRYLTHRGYEVTYVQNVTDIDDKIIDRVKKSGEDPIAMTRAFTDEFYGALQKLNVLPVSQLTRVTEFMDKIISFISGLIEKGFAYATEDGNVYFDVAKCSAYGKLSNQDTKMLYESVRKELDKNKHSPLDFALWKRDETSSLSSPSPWGVGRPGWHIECSAMIYEALGPQIDIHGGGLDLKFPHHENEIAQSECFTGKPLANVWMHTGLLNINGQKMSKSLKNFVRLIDAVEKYGPDMLRFVILRHHYRSSIDFTDKLFKDNLNSVLDFYRLFESTGVTSGKVDNDSPLTKSFNEAMDNDFNTAESIVVLEQERDRLKQEIKSKGAESVKPQLIGLRGLCDVLGLFDGTLKQFETDGLSLTGSLRGNSPISPSDLISKLAERIKARESKDYNRSDEIRNELSALGVEILDSKEGSTWRFLS